MAPSESQNVYRRMRMRFGTKKLSGRKQIVGSMPFAADRDPEQLRVAMVNLASSMGWSEKLAEAELFGSWSQIVGKDVAEHAYPLRVVDGVLEIQADSSAWATQLRLMRKILLNSIVDKFPESGISQIMVRAPGAPSWKHGSRSVSGSGPRDTYG